MARIWTLVAAVVLLVTAAASAQPVEATHEFFTTKDGVKIHYMTAGREGSWVVLVHGFTDTAQRMWFYTGIAGALAATHRVVALDNRNHGQSDKPQPNGPGRAEDVIELMDHLRIDRAHIHGYSMGGGITGRLLAASPDRFITASFGGSGIQEADPTLRERAAALDKPMPEPQGAEAAAFQRLRDRVAALGSSAGPSTPLNAPTIDLTAVKVPVLAINGEFDGPYAKTHRLWRELRDFQNVVLPGKNHLTAIAVGGPMPPEYAEALVRFINSHDTAAPVPGTKPQ